VTALAFDECRQPATRAEHRVRLPVPGRAAGFDRCGALADRHAIGNAGSLWAASIGFSAKFAALAQTLPERASCGAIGFDVAIDAGVAHPHLLVVREVGRDPAADL